MTTPRLGANVRVEIQSTLGSPVTVSAVTKANPGVVSATAHGFSNGDVVVFAVSDGMVEIDKQAVRVANKTTDAFEAEGLNTTNFSTFTAGTCTKVTAFSTWGNTTQIDNPNVEPNKQDVSTLLDTETQEIFGRKNASTGNVLTIFDPSLAAEALIQAATDTNTPIAFRVTWAGGQKRIWNSYVSGGNGFTQPNNGVATSQHYFTKIKKAMDYAS